MDGQGLSQLKCHRKKQKLCALGRHKSSRCGTRTFISCQSFCAVRPYRHSCSRSVGTQTGLWTCSVTTSHSAAMLQNYAIRKLLRYNAQNYIVWMQNSAPSHIVCSQGPGTVLSCSHHLKQFFFSVSSTIPPIWVPWISGFKDISNLEFTCAIHKHCRN